jgi:hypothetical protein
VLRTQCRELPPHLNQIEGLVIRLLFQMKNSRPRLNFLRSRRAEYIGATTSPWVDPDGAMSVVVNLAEPKVSAIELAN